MKCAPRAGWIFVGFGVAISLLFAIFVLALANSKRRVWGFSGSKRIPWGRDAGGEEGGHRVREVGWVKGGAAAQLSLMASFPKAVPRYSRCILRASLQLKPPLSSCGIINRHPDAFAHIFRVMPKPKDTLLEHLSRLVSRFLVHSRASADRRRSLPRCSSQEEGEMRKRADGESFLWGGWTLLVFLCPKHCAHMQVSSILVCVCCLCVWLLVCLRGDAHKEG